MYPLHIAAPSDSGRQMALAKDIELTSQVLVYSFRTHVISHHLHQMAKYHMLADEALQPEDLKDGMVLETALPGHYIEVAARSTLTLAFMYRVHLGDQRGRHNHPAERDGQQRYNLANCL